jgi:hypothetical protein
MPKTSPPPAPAASPQGDQGGVFECIAEDEVTYLPPGAPPQTSTLGDVCELSFTPTDGRWQPTTKAVTRLPDNHPDVAQAREDAQVAARQAAAEKVLADMAAPATPLATPTAEAAASTGGSEAA